MRFKFYGDADCPDWLLMQINALSEMSCSNLEALSEMVAQSLYGKDLDYSKVAELAPSSDMNETKACISALRLIIRGAVCHGVTAAQLSAELEQLGLHQTHAAALSSVFSSHKQALTNKLKIDSLRMGRLLDMEIHPVESTPDVYNLRLDIWNEESEQQESKVFTAHRNQLAMMVADLKTVQNRMDLLSKVEES